MLSFENVGVYFFFFEDYVIFMGFYWKFCFFKIRLLIVKNFLFFDKGVYSLFLL